MSRADEFTTYTTEQLLKLVDSVQVNALERTDLVYIIRELAQRCKVLQAALGRF